jgi:predicted RecA/RadA family phage recombinase
MMKPKARQILYVVGVVVFAALTVLSTFKVIDPDTAAVVSAALTSVLGLFGVTLAGTAAYNTGKQINDGVFEKAPELSPADSVVNGVQAVLEAKQRAEQELERVQDAITGVIDDIPVLGPLAQQVLDQLKR